MEEPQEQANRNQDGTFKKGYFTVFAGKKILGKFSGSRRPKDVNCANCHRLKTVTNGDHNGICYVPNQQGINKDYAI